VPLGAGVRYRMKKTSKGNVRLAFKGGKVIEATPMAGALAAHIRKGKFKKGKHG